MDIIYIDPILSPLKQKVNIGVSPKKPLIAPDPKKSYICSPFTQKVYGEVAQMVRAHDS